MSQIQKIKEESQTKPVMIFKHSTRCSISAMALNRMERDYDAEQLGETPVYFLDLIANRDVSTAVAEAFGVMHQSPQVLLIKGGESVYDDSHMGISFNEVAAHAKQAAQA